MEPRIIVKPAFTVIGLPHTGLLSSGPFEDGVNNNEIGETWNRFNARAGELQRDVNGDAIGLCFGMPDEHEPWYLAGLEVREEAAVPAGMMKMHVPEQKYAVFRCTLPAIGETYRFIQEEWQPRSGYERADAPDFELYGSDWDAADEQNAALYLYWPIK